MCLYSEQPYHTQPYHTHYLHARSLYTPLWLDPEWSTISKSSSSSPSGLCLISDNQFWMAQVVWDTGVLTVSDVGVLASLAEVDSCSTGRCSQSSTRDDSLGNVTRICRKMVRGHKTLVNPPHISQVMQRRKRLTPLYAIRGNLSDFELFVQCLGGKSHTEDSSGMIIHEQQFLWLHELWHKLADRFKHSYRVQALDKAILADSWPRGEPLIHVHCWGWKQRTHVAPKCYATEDTLHARTEANKEKDTDGFANWDLPSESDRHLSLIYSSNHLLLSFAFCSLAFFFPALTVNSLKGLRSTHTPHSLQRYLTNVIFLWTHTCSHGNSTEIYFHCPVQG